MKKLLCTLLASLALISVVFGWTVVKWNSATLYSSDKLWCFDTTTAAITYSGSPFTFTNTVDSLGFYYYVAGAGGNDSNAVYLYGVSPISGTRTLIDSVKCAANAEGLHITSVVGTYVKFEFAFKRYVGTNDKTDSCKILYWPIPRWKDAP